MIQTAIILAAGCGSRLRPHLDEALPKGALELEGIAIVERSIQTLLKQGFTRIVIGTGHGHEWYDQLAQKHTEITCIKNNEFDQSGSMHTLSLILESYTDDCLLLESDLIYESRAIQCLVDFPDRNIILSTPYREVGDEVFIEVNQNNLVTMGKESQYAKEHVLAGITKCSKELLEKMNNFYKTQKTKKVDYEDCLVGCRHENITVLNNPDITIMEIDDAEHLTLAKTVLPTIIHNSTVQHHEKKYLLNPGPATTSQRVKYAQIIPDICPRELEYNAVVAEVQHRLNHLASSNPETIASILFTGSGTAAVESMISSCTGPEGSILIVNQGAYGKRMIEIATIHNIKHYVYSPDPLLPLNLAELEQQLTTLNPTHCAIVHHETTTGLLNDIHAVGKLCKTHNCAVCVDAMSSLGAIPLDMEKDHLDFVTGSSNKNIQGMAGLGVVIAKKNALEALKDNPKKTLYLDLYAQYVFSEHHKQSQFTPAVQCTYAFREALRELAEEGVENRYNRYKTNWKMLANCMASHGFKHLIEPEHHGYIITSYIVDENISFSFDAFHDYLYRKHITIYPGKIADFNTFRVANIGVLTTKDCTYICDQINRYFKTKTT